MHAVQKVANIVPEIRIGKTLIPKRKLQPSLNNETYIQKLVLLDIKIYYISINTLVSMIVLIFAISIFIGVNISTNAIYTRQKR